jgi:hypothetical protein
MAPSRIRKCFGNHRATQPANVCFGLARLPEQGKSLVIEGLWKLLLVFVTNLSCARTSLKLLMGEQLWQIHQARTLGEDRLPNAYLEELADKFQKANNPPL